MTWSRRALLDPRCWGPALAAEDGASTQVALIDASRCVSHGGLLCRSCVDACPQPGALILDGSTPRIDADRCDGCGRCCGLCPGSTPALRLWRPDRHRPRRRI